MADDRPGFRLRLNPGYASSGRRLIGSPGRDAQAAARRVLPVLRERRCRGNILDDAPRVLEHGGAEIGDAELAGGAQQQPFA